MRYQPGLSVTLPPSSIAAIQSSYSGSYGIVPAWHCKRSQCYLCQPSHNQDTHIVLTYNKIGIRVNKSFYLYYVIPKESSFLCFIPNFFISIFSHSLQYFGCSGSLLEYTIVVPHRHTTTALSRRSVLSIRYSIIPSTRKKNNNIYGQVRCYPERNLNRDSIRNTRSI